MIFSTKKFLYHIRDHQTLELYLFTKNTKGIHSFTFEHKNFVSHYNYGIRYKLDLGDHTVVFRNKITNTHLILSLETLSLARIPNANKYPNLGDAFGVLASAKMMGRASIETEYISLKNFGKTYIRNLPFKELNTRNLLKIFVFPAMPKTYLYYVVLSGDINCKLGQRNCKTSFPPTYENFNEQLKLKGVGSVIFVAFKTYNTSSGMQLKYPAKLLGMISKSK